MLAHYLWDDFIADVTKIDGRNSDISLRYSILGMRQILVCFRRGQWHWSEKVFDILACHFRYEALILLKEKTRHSIWHWHFVGVYVRNCFCISSSDGIFVILSFIARLFLSVIYWWDFSKSEGCEEVKKVWKYPVTTFQYWLRSLPRSHSVSKA